MATSRKNRNYKERRPMFAFSQFILPLSAILAVGLLFMGIKLFFFSPDEKATKPTEYIPKNQNINALPQNEKTTLSEEISLSQDSSAATRVLLAGPADMSADQLKKLPVSLSDDQTTKKEPKKGEDQKKSEPDKKSTSKITSEKKEKPVQKQVDNKKAEKAPVAKQEKKSQSKTDESKQKTAVSQKQVDKKEPEKREPDKKGIVSETKKDVDPGKKGNWGVQIGSFSKREGAEALIKKAQQEGYSPVISQLLVEGTPFFRVRIRAGAYRNDAEQLAESLQKKGYPVAVVALN